MTEAEARQWTVDKYPDAVAAIDRFLALLIVESARQNLIARSTMDRMWSRHVVDSLQLVEHARDGMWCDIGSGGGFPGIVVAIVREQPMMLIEPRRKRADFLASVVSQLGLSAVQVRQAYAERVEADAAVISARAVAGIDQLIDVAKRWSCPTTRWILPRGTVSEDEMDMLRHRFGEMFHVEHSITSPGSSIVIADGRPS